AYRLLARLGGSGRLGHRPRCARRRRRLCRFGASVRRRVCPPPGTLVFTLLGVALLIALGFEFVNGFHDTANAVATVIYTHSPTAYVAVIWSDYGTSSGCSPQLERWPSESSHCCRSSSFYRSGAMLGSRWFLPCS